MRTTTLQPRLGRRAARAVAALAFCAALAGSVGAASATGGHLPGFSVANRRIDVSKLPPPIRYSFGEIPAVKSVSIGPKIRGPVWFGRVERPNATIYAAGNSRWVCEAEQPDDRERGEESACTTLGGARDLGLLNVGSCGKGPPRHFRIHALVPDGVTGLVIEKGNGSVARTVPVIENTVAFTIGRENIVLRGAGDTGAEELERTLPLARAAKDSPSVNRGGCTYYTFAEAGPTSEAAT